MIRTLRCIGEALWFGPLYALVQRRLNSPRPLEGEENWNFWMRQPHRLIRLILESFPPVGQRKLILRKALIPNHAQGISAHYDLGNQFYSLFLDREFMFYSCADFDDQAITLEEAQRRKADHILSLLDPHPDEKILDLGCGWGGMLRRVSDATQNTENLHGYTLSRRQVDFIQDRYNFGVSLKDFITENYEPESYDKIYSIGAWEHVRPEEILPTLKKLHRALRPGGILVQQFFCLNEDPWPVWMIAAQLFFPGSLLTAWEKQEAAVDSSGFSLTHHSRHDYRPTLRAWYERLVENKNRAIEIAGIPTYNKYLTFFPISWRFFSEGLAQVHRLVLTKRL